MEVLCEVLGTTCPECGERHGWSAQASSCGALLRPEEGDFDEESLFFLHSEGLENAPDSAQGSHKLKRLLLALKGARAGSLHLEAYREVVSRVLQEARAILLQLEALRRIEAELGPEAVGVLRETTHQVDAFAQACERMLLFDGRNIAVADSGFHLARSTVAGMLANQREAAELQAQYQAG